MYIQASQLIGHALVALESRQVIGRVERPIFDPTKGQLVALTIRSRGWFGKKQLLAASDILGVEPGFVLTRKLDDLVEPKELIRVQDIIKAKMPILGQQAVTESGQSLGQITDVLLDTDAWLIIKYYLHQLLSERILLAEDVQAITKKAVVFFDRVNGPLPADAETAVA